MMTTPKPSVLTLETVAEHFAQWRETKAARERIPEPLWREAIELLDTYRISQITRTLGLSGSDLNKRRRQLTSPPPADAQDSRHTFVELQAPLINPASAKAARWLELQRPDGLCLRLHAGDRDDLLALVDRFIGGGPC
jgi:hypothetical protein